MTATIVEYALMAGAAYVSNRPDLDNRIPTPTGWSQIDKLLDPKSGFEGYIYMNAAKTDIVISYAGTSFNFDSLTRTDQAIADLATDYSLYRGCLGAVADDAFNLALITLAPEFAAVKDAFDDINAIRNGNFGDLLFNLLKQAFPAVALVETGLDVVSLGYGLAQLLDAAALYEDAKAYVAASGINTNISFTGHSLGGGLADLMGTFFDKPAVSFDPAPFYNSLNEADALLLKYITPDPALDSLVRPNWLFGDSFNSRLAQLESIATDGEVLSTTNEIAKVAGLTGITGGFFQNYSSVQSTVIAHGGMNSPGDVVNLHSMALLIALESNQNFQLATTNLPFLLSDLFNSGPGYYGNDPTNAGGRVDLLSHLISYEHLPTDPNLILLNDFSADLVKLGLATAADPLRESLLNMLMQYEYLTKSVAPSTFFADDVTGGVRFDLSQPFGDSVTSLDKINGWHTAGYTSLLEALESEASSDSAALGAIDAFLRTPHRLTIGLSGAIESVAPADGGVDFMITGQGGGYLNGSNGNDLLIGLSGVDTLDGGAGIDAVYGGGGNDILETFDGSSDIATRDLLNGGAGNDTYIVDVPAGGKATIQDSSGTDVLNIRSGTSGVLAVYTRTQFLAFDSAHPGRDLTIVTKGASGVVLSTVTIENMDVADDRVETLNLSVSATTVARFDLNTAWAAALAGDTTGGASFVGTFSAVATVTTPTISVSDAVVGEGQGYAEFVVSLSAPSSQAVSVYYGTTAGSASNYYDFQAIGSALLSFAAGETVKTVRVALNDDSTAETTESFYLGLSSPTNGLLGKSLAVGTIIDNDGAAGTPVVSVSDAVVDEKAGLAYFTFTLDKPSTSAVSLTYQTADGTAVAGIDYQALAAQTLSFAPGEMAKTVAVNVIDDATTEPGEYFSLVLSGVSGATLPDTRGIAYIGASDAATVATPTISVSDAVVGEGQGYAEFVVSLSAPSSQAVSVYYGTTAGSASNYYDFQAIGSALLSFAAGETVKTVRVALNDDSTAETTESFYLGLSSPTNGLLGKSLAVGTIIDNDGAAGTPVVSVSDAVVDEKAGLAYFTFTLDKPSTSAVSLTYQTADGTAVAGIDYQALAAQTLSFAPGEMAKTVAVQGARLDGS